MTTEEEQESGAHKESEASETSINLPAALLAVIAILLICGLGSYTVIKVVGIIVQ